MEITNYGTFSQVAAGGYFLYENQEGHDWNDMQMGRDDAYPALVHLTELGAFVDSVHPVWAAVVDGVVTNVERDPSRIVPNGATVLGIDAEFAEVIPGMRYIDGELLPALPPSQQDYTIDKTLPWERMTDDEATIMDGVLAQVPAKQRNTYNSAQYLDTRHALWETLKQLLADNLPGGMTRANELLAPK